MHRLRETLASHLALGENAAAAGEQLFLHLQHRGLPPVARARGLLPAGRDADALDLALRPSLSRGHPARPAGSRGAPPLDHEQRRIDSDERSRQPDAAHAPQVRGRPPRTQPGEGDHDRRCARAMRAATPRRPARQFRGCPPRAGRIAVAVTGDMSEPGSLAEEFEAHPADQRLRNDGDGRRRGRGQETDAHPGGRPYRRPSHSTGSATATGLPSRRSRFSSGE